MKKKILAIVRESTTRQSPESQERELTEFIKSKGYTEEEIDYIVATGASAHQANESYLNYLQEIKNKTQGEDGIKTVCLWHLNRLGRIKQYLAEMEHFFVENKIQMFVKLGFDMPLLGEDGKETTGASIAFSVYSALVEVETQEMFEKMRRGKEQNKREGKYNGGKIKFGYTLNEENKYIIDPETSGIVYDIFNKYINEDWSCKKIYDYYTSLGVFQPYHWKNHGYRVITKMLKDEAYTKGQEPYYKPFIPVEMQEKALSMLERFKERKRSGNIYFCKGLLTDKETGLKLGASRGTLVYTHLIREKSYNISINVLDYIAWREARNIYIFKDAWQNSENEEVYNNQIEENEKRIKLLNDSIEDLRNKISDAYEMAVRKPKYFPIERAEQLEKENEKQITLLEKEVSAMIQQNLRMKGLLQATEQKGKNLLRIKSINDPFFEEMNDEEKKKIIDECISKIEVDRLKEKHYIIRIHQPIEIARTSEWEYYNSGHKIYLTEKTIAKDIDHTKAIHDRKNHHFIREDYWRRYYKPKNKIED